MNVAEHKAVLVSVTAVQGSTPRDTDAWMLVTNEGFHGTIGGGTLEWKAMAEAQKMLLQGGDTKFVDYVLGPDLGQCCGGRVQLKFELQKTGSVPNREDHRNRTILIFGAGHVGRALILALAPLSFAVRWIDPRPNAFPTFAPENVKLINSEAPVAEIAAAPKGSFVFVMSHSHALDFELVDAGLRNASVFEVGVIGSATKRARFEKRLREAGHTEHHVAKLICPIGVSGITSKHPAAIAAAVVAQCLQLESHHSALNSAVISKAI